MDIKKVFEAASDRDAAFVYIAKKIASEKKIENRLGMFIDLTDYLEQCENEREQYKQIRINNPKCDKCGDYIDPEGDGTCDNCNSISEQQTHMDEYCSRCQSILSASGYCHNCDENEIKRITYVQNSSK